MNEDIARIRRGYARMGAAAVEWTWERPNALLARQSLMAWRSQRRQTREWRTEADTALAAAALDTVEGDIQVSQQRPAFNNEIERLLLIPKRSMEEERRLAWLQRKVREIDRLVATRGATPETVGPVRMRFMGPVGAARGLLGGWQVWVLAAALSGWGAAAVQAALKERVEDQRDSARAERNALQASRDAYARELVAARATHQRDVAAVLEDTARTVEQLQRREARNRALAARERSRHEELATGSVDFRERLRELSEPVDAGLSDLPAGAAGDRPAGGLSIGARPDPDADPAS